MTTAGGREPVAAVCMMPPRGSQNAARTLVAENGSFKSSRLRAKANRGEVPHLLPKAASWLRQGQVLAQVFSHDLVRCSSGTIPRLISRRMCSLIVSCFTRTPGRACLGPRPSRPPRLMSTLPAKNKPQPHTGGHRRALKRLSIVGNQRPSCRHLESFTNAVV